MLTRTGRFDSVPQYITKDLNIQCQHVLSQWTVTVHSQLKAAICFSLLFFRWGVLTWRVPQIYTFKCKTEKWPHKTVSLKKISMLKFLLNKKMCGIALPWRYTNVKISGIFVIYSNKFNSSLIRQFQFDQVTTYNFLLKPFDNALTLK